MRISTIAIFSLIFMLGWLSSSIFSQAIVFDEEQPLSFSILLNKAVERKSPADHVAENGIHVYPDKVVLDIDNAFFAKYADTNSMDPLLDKGANGIEIIPKSPTMIKVGDVISYTSDHASGIVVHRVVEKGYDDKGAYFIVKGDNNDSVDPQKIRFDQVKGVLVGIIY